MSFASLSVQEYNTPIEKREYFNILGEKTQAGDSGRAISSNVRQMDAGTGALRLLHEMVGGGIFLRKAV